jgi:urea transport system substrate-binding protein
MNTSRRQAGQAIASSLTALALAATGLGASSLAFAQGTGPIKVGILHSLSGTMAISETVLRA